MKKLALVTALLVQGGTTMAKPPGSFIKKVRLIPEPSLFESISIFSDQAPPAHLTLELELDVNRCTNVQSVHPSLYAPAATPKIEVFLDLSKNKECEGYGNNVTHHRVTLGPWKKGQYEVQIIENGNPIHAEIVAIPKAHQSYERPWLRVSDGLRTEALNHDNTLEDSI